MHRSIAEMFVEAIYELAHDADKTMRERADDREKLLRLIETLAETTDDE